MPVQGRVKKRSHGTLATLQTKTPRKEYEPREHIKSSGKFCAGRKPLDMRVKYSNDLLEVANGFKVGRGDGKGEVEVV